LAASIKAFGPRNLPWHSSIPDSTFPPCEPPSPNTSLRWQALHTAISCVALPARMESRGRRQALGRPGGPDENPCIHEFRNSWSAHSLRGDISWVR
jgi:hypothetical protein